MGNTDNGRIFIDNRKRGSCLSLFGGTKRNHFEHLHPEGLKALILNTKLPGKLGFTQEEVSKIIGDIEQALIMNEVFASLSN